MLPLLLLVMARLYALGSEGHRVWVFRVQGLGSGGHAYVWLLRRRSGLVIEG